MCSPAPIYGCGGDLIVRAKIVLYNLRSRLGGLNFPPRRIRRCPGLPQGSHQKKELNNKRAFRFFAEKPGGFVFESGSGRGGSGSDPTAGKSLQKSQPTLHKNYSAQHLMAKLGRFFSLSKSPHLNSYYSSTKAICATLAFLRRFSTIFQFWL